MQLPFFVSLGQDYLQYVTMQTARHSLIDSIMKKNWKGFLWKAWWLINRHCCVTARISRLHPCLLLGCVLGQHHCQHDRISRFDKRIKEWNIFLRQDSKMLTVLMHLFRTKYSFFFSIPKHKNSPKEWRVSDHVMKLIWIY